ncbi:MAG TPA: choice-of-anchor D domain-containing protein [Acidimicrobiia bacterium]|nr:choice-of-anchor D domain-containing protein [Acidimicrobiia bacterium]
MGTGGLRARVGAALMAVLASGATFAAVGGITPAPAGAQMTDHATALPGLMRFEVVDAASKHVFVSLYDTSKVAVLDFSGNLVHTISGEAGARGLAVVGTTLYVAAATAGAIDTFDTGTFAKTGTLATGIAGMDYLASAAGALWVVPSSTGLLTRVSLADGSTQAFANPIVVDGVGLAADPANPNRLAMFVPGDSPTTVAIMDLSGATPVKVALKRLETEQVSNSQDFAWTPDGTSVFSAGGAPYQFVGLDSTTLADTGVVYPANPYPTSVATTAAAGGLFAGGMNGIYNPDVVVYRLGVPSAPIASHDFGPTDQTVEGGGVRFSPDGTRVFAITGDHGHDAPKDTFHVLTIAGATVPSPFTLSPSPESFGFQRVGTYGLSRTVTVTNTGSSAATITAIGIGGANSYDFFGTTTCRVGKSLAAGNSCTATIAFGALKLGARQANLVVRSANSSASAPLTGSGTEGYYLADARGGAAGFGDASVLGVAEHALAAPVISITPTANGAGFWLLARDGGIFSYGNAAFHGSTGAMKLNKPIVGMAATPTGKGYWLVASDGGIFSFGDAKFYGSTGNIHLSRPIIGMAPTASGHGYEFVANDGGVFSYGDAHFFGSAANSGARIVGLAGTPTGKGYWMVSSGGQVFRYGDAPAYGDAASRGVTDVIGIAGTAPLIPPALVGVARASSSGLTPLTARSSTRLAYRP